MVFSRRSFFKGITLSGIAAAGIISGSNKALASTVSSYATVIDLSRCNGCAHANTPQCVLACRTKNKNNFPQPHMPIKDYWPQNKHEDWSDKQQLTNRLTPYNWTYVQHLEVEYNGNKSKVHVPRRCMHCDNAPCSDLCPFGVNEKTPEGPVVIDTNGCFGGAKCRDVCPWHIPQRQAGVGIYLKVAPDYAGGGVMYKCDMCYDLILKGQEPACVSSCPNQAILFGKKEEMRAYARHWAEQNSGYIYGDVENGGTATFYLSSIPYEEIDKAILAQDIDGKNGRVNMAVNIQNPMEKPNGMVKSLLIAPVAGLLASGLSAYKIMKGVEVDENTQA